MEKGLVSIISPCYNREKILWRFLDSILAQTYKQLQLILIDDGSTDGTLDVIKKYTSKFKDAGIEYEYHTKPNGGVSSAINEGLKYVRGEFLCWPDSDDWYEPEAMEKRVAFLNQHEEYAIVSCDANAIQEGSMDVVVESVAGSNSVKYKPKQFNLLLEGHSLICSLCHMVRTEAFFNAHPNRRIFDSRHGQNIQMLLPVYYSYDRGFIDECLCHYLVLDGSLSRSDDTFEKKLAYRNSIETLMLATLNEIEMSDKEKECCIKYTKVKNTRRRLLLAYQFHQKEFAKQQLKDLFAFKSVNLKDIFYYLSI